MMVSNRGSIFGLLAWQWKNTALFTTFATVVVLSHVIFGWTWLQVPALPLGIVGGAIGIFVSFRTNSAYDRWWEGRKLWGRMINTSRHICSQILVYLPKTDGKPSALQRRLVKRHQAYVHALRCGLRTQNPFDDEEFLGALPDDPDTLRTQSNLTHALLTLQLEEVTAASRERDIDEFQLSNFDLSIRHLLDIQGGCERIKKTPMPRGYGYIAERLVLAFSILLPMAIVSELGWWTILINLVVCLAFALISEAGRVLEDPFTMFWNALPLSAISRMIEVNLEDRMGTAAADLPPLLGPNDKGILM